MGYQAGICNIGSRSRLTRLSYGLFFFAATFWVWSFLGINAFPAFYRMVLIIPLFLGFIGFYQAAFSFCVVNAYKRKHDFGKKKISHQHHAADKGKAFTVLMISALSALVATVALFLL